ncbi:MAG: S1C family serine protease [Patescibacteria group bacterium]
MRRIGPVFAMIFAIFVSAAQAAPTEYYIPKPDGKYDNHAYLVNPEKYSFNLVKNSVVRLENTTEFKGSDGRPVSNTRIGGGVILGKYVLTVAHVSVQDALKIPMPPFGSIAIPARKISEKTFAVLDGVKVLLTAVHIKREDDIAIFKLPDDISVGAFPYEIGDSDDLEIGNMVYVVGNPLNMGVNVRQGIVSAVEAPKETEGVDGKSKNFFMLSSGVYGGDSGTPVIAVRDGRFELVGISEGVFGSADQLGFAIRINVVKRIVEDCRKCSEDLKDIFRKKAR